MQPLSTQTWPLCNLLIAMHGSPSQQLISKPAVRHAAIDSVPSGMTDTMATSLWPGLLLPSEPAQASSRGMLSVLLLRKLSVEEALFRCSPLVEGGS